MPRTNQLEPFCQFTGPASIHSFNYTKESSTPSWFASNIIPGQPIEMWTSSRAAPENRCSSGIDNPVTIFQSKDSHRVINTTHLLPTVQQAWCYYFSFYKKGGDSCGNLIYSPRASRYGLMTVSTRQVFAYPLTFSRSAPGCSQKRRNA